MTTIIIILVLLVVLVVVAGTMLGRISHEVESARDTEYVELDGHWVRYTVIGGGPPVLLVHGWLSSHRIWEQLARRLAQRFTVYSLDLTGFGDSDKPKDGYGTRNGSRLLYAFCAQFGLTRATIVGHDFSGSMAVKLAADHPDIVGRLILMSTPADEEQIDLPTLLWLTTLPVVGPIFYSLGQVLSPLRKLWMRSFVFDRQDLPAELVEDSGKPTPSSASKTYSITRHEISGGRVARQARIIKVPVLLISGEDDQIIDPRAVSDWGQYAEQAEIALIDKCGHLPMVEQPAEVSARILAFLTGDSRYMEHVKEVPPPAEQPMTDQLEETGDELDENPSGNPEAEDLEAEEQVRPEPPEVVEGETSTDGGTDFGDVSWDFSPKTPRPPQSDRRPTPRPKEPDVQRSEPQSETPDEPRTPPRPSRRPTPPPRNRDAAEAEEVEEAARGSSELKSGNSSQPNDERKSGSGGIPEFPGDLFEWSKAPEEYSPERRRRRGSGSERRKKEKEE